MHALLRFSLSAALTLSSAALAGADIELDQIIAFDNAGDIEVTVSVLNIGDAAVGGFWVDLYGSKGAQWDDESQNTHYEAYVSGLNPAHSEKIIFTLTSDEWENSGMVFATADVNFAQAEDDESNNMAELIIMDQDPNEPALACGTSSATVPGPLKDAIYMTEAFINANTPYLYCKSRAL